MTNVGSTRDDLLDMFNELSYIWPRFNQENPELQSRKVIGWMKELEEFPRWVLMKAARRHIRTSRWEPKPADIWGHCNSIYKQDNHYEAIPMDEVDKIWESRGMKRVIPPHQKRMDFILDNCGAGPTTREFLRLIQKYFPNIEADLAGAMHVTATPSLASEVKAKLDELETHANRFKQMEKYK